MAVNEPPSDAQRRLLQKIRSLLAKAESTSFEHEATALTAKAQELITQHAIDVALLEARDGRGAVTTRVVFIPAPYPKQKYLLLNGVAGANGARAILGMDLNRIAEMARAGEYFDRPGEYATLIGYESDLDSIELLFTSLLVQAVNCMLAHGSQVSDRGRNRTRSFRSSFLHGFAVTVAGRLDEARTSVVEAVDTNSAVSVLPVLAGRRADVDDFVAERFPHLERLRSSVTNHAGVLAGRDAGEQADIGMGRVGRSRRQLT